MNNKILKIKAKKVFVLCFAWYKTGGTELMHQLVYYLNKLGQDASIVYVGDKMEINPAYNEYLQRFITLDNVIDSEENVLIVPETMIYYTRNYKKIKKVIWWLSVDNFTKFEGVFNFIKVYGIIHGMSASLKALRNHHLRQMPYVYNCDYHLCQSYYALDYLASLKIPNECVGYLSDYINDTYLKKNYEYTSMGRQNVVLYNPKKGYEITKKLMETDDSLIWKPLINMSNAEMNKTMEQGKVYIDFGNHPGKDRIPREAAISGCCIITGKKGSAGYEKDVSIPEEYKFDDVNNENIDVDAILKAIHRCLENYDIEINKYCNYRMDILNEKDKFIKNVTEIFIN